MYESVESDPTTFATVDIPIYVAYLSNIPFNLPSLGSATINGSYVPISVETLASATESVPRFADTSTSTTAFTIGFCACTTLSSGSASFGPGGGSGSITVTASNTCSWNSFSLDSWISVTPPQGHLRNGTVAYTVAANPTTSARSGTISAGQNFTVNQAGVSCAFSVSPLLANFGNSGGAGSFTITANVNTCVWTATADSGWITLTRSLTA